MRWTVLCFLLLPLLSQRGTSFPSASATNLNDKPPSYEKQPEFYTYSKTGCVGDYGREYSFIQCEGGFFMAVVMFKSKDYTEEGYIRVQCNSTIDYSDLDHDYPNLVGLNRTRKYKLSLLDCPEPRTSYVRQIFPRSEASLEGSTPKDEIIRNNIYGLKIECERRRNFTITKTHLQNLSQTKELNVTCAALEHLPFDLFHGTVPLLENINIDGTRIEYVPKRLFYNLTKLREVRLVNNLVKHVRGDAFLGCRNLISVNIRGNRLLSIEEDLMKTLENITLLDLSENFLEDLPKAISKLSKLKLLDLSRNLLQRMNAEHCNKASNIEILNVSYNGMTFIHPNCFGSNLTKLNVEGNSLELNTERPIQLDKLRTFYFKANSVTKLKVKKFLTSGVLYYFLMSKSNIISVDNDTLHGFPSLKVVDFTDNDIEVLPVNLFVKNLHIHTIFLQKNSIHSLPQGLFLHNIKMYNTDFSRNEIKKLPINLFPENSTLYILDVSFNRLENISARFFANITSLSVFDCSHNDVKVLRNDTFQGMNRLRRIDLSSNTFSRFDADLFQPLKLVSNLKRLYLRDNSLSSLPNLHLEKLESLDASGNKLQMFSGHFLSSLPNLKFLNLSRNNITLIEYKSPGRKKTKKLLQILDLSHNHLRNIPYSFCDRFREITSLDLSNNFIETFHFRFLTNVNKLERLNLSYNNITYFGSNINKFASLPKILDTNIKVLDLSNNKIHFNYRDTYFDEESLTWGRGSAFVYLKNLEVLLLSNNAITSILMEWRLKLPNLKFLDLKYNKLRFITDQEMIFSSTSRYEKLGFGPYSCKHNLTVDLRHNEIRFVDLPSRTLAVLPKKNETKGAYGHVSMLIDNNPFECGCALFNLLRVIRYDVALTSQVKRVKGLNGMLPAKLELGNLSCSKPESIRGKKLNNSEEWIHHLVPLFGICSLRDILSSEAHQKRDD